MVLENDQGEKREKKEKVEKRLIRTKMPPSSKAVKFAQFQRLSQPSFAFFEIDDRNSIRPGYILQLYHPLIIQPRHYALGPRTH